MFGFFKRRKPYSEFKLKVLPVEGYQKTEPFRTSNERMPTQTEAMEYVPFARCVNLIANKAADMISSGLRVVDADGELAYGARQSKATDLLRHSPDGVQTGNDFMRELMFDYLVEGNAIVHVEKTMNDRLLGLTRMDASNARIMIGKQEYGLRGLVYHVVPMGFDTTMVYPVSKIAHARYVPFSEYLLNTSDRQFMSTSPLKMLKKAILIGRYADNWVGEFFNSANKSNMVIVMPEDMDKKKQEELMRSFELSTKSTRAPFVLYGGADVKQVATDPQNANALELREYGVQEIARFYGVPAPLIGLNVTQWGSGIEELAKLAFKYGIKPHMERLLTALSLRMLPMGQRFEVDAMRELEGDTEAKVSLAEVMKPSNNGPAIGSVKEVRQMLGLHGDFEDDWPEHSVDGNSKSKTEKGDNDVSEMRS